MVLLVGFLGHMTGMADLLNGFHFKAFIYGVLPHNLHISLKISSNINSIISLRIYSLSSSSLQPFISNEILMCASDGHVRG